MTRIMIERLVRKDWYFNRGMIVVCLALGAVALLAVGLGGKGAFYFGAVLLISVVIGLGAYLAIATVIYERKDQTLPFVMSLPISPMVYTTAKVLANMLIFLVPWTALAVGSFVVLAGREVLPNGLIPFTAIMLTELFAAYCLLLAVALISESEGWTIFVMIACNLSFNYFLYFGSHIEGIAVHMEGPTAVWDAPVLWTLAASVAAIALFLGATFYFQSRKTDFL